MKKLFLFLSLFIGMVARSQKADNNFHGYFESTSDSMYQSFKFHGNGQVTIAGVGYGDYFVRNDSLIVYPDKSIFIFRISRDKSLTGLSDWVQGESWKPVKDSVVVNMRKNDETAVKQAILLAEYYDKTKKMSDIEAVFDENGPKMNEDLCNRGLVKSCLNVFGYKMLEYTPDLLTTPDKIPSRKLKPHPELIALAQKITQMGSPEGHTALAGYYYILGMKDEAGKEYDKAIEKGSLTAMIGQLAVDNSEE